MKIKILYHSGAGSTKTIAEIFYAKLKGYQCSIEQISLNYDYNNLSEYEHLIFAFPTYHCEPSRSMMEFINRMPKLLKARSAFVFTTYGLYSGNALRIFIKACNDKNINVYGYNAYRSPATDGSLLFPHINFMFKYGKKVPRKISNDLNIITDVISNNTQQNRCPHFKLYTILNFPNKYFGKRHVYKLSVLKDRCIKCNYCVKQCIRGCWKMVDEELIFDISNCESCLKCIHHCPSSAIIINKKTVKKQKMNSDFYEALKSNILKGEKY